MTNPIDNEDLYDAIVLAGTRSPGKVTLSGHDRVEKWDVKDADGQAGGTTTHNGKKIGEFTATFALVKDPILGIDDFAAWDPFAELIESSVSGAQSKALDVYHPDLARNGYTSVVKRKMGGMVHDGKGGATVAVVFGEYSPKKKKSSSPAGSKSADPAKANDPNAAAKAELEQWLAEANDQPAKLQKVSNGQPG